MYKKEFNELYIDNNHGLININEGFWVNFKITKSTDRNLLFNTKTLDKSEWSIIKDKLAKLKKFTNIKEYLFLEYQSFLYYLDCQLMILIYFCME